MLTKVEFSKALQDIDTLLDNLHTRKLTDSEERELHELGLQVSEYEEAHGITVPDIYGIEMLQQLMKEYGYTLGELIEVLGKEAYSTMYKTNHLTDLDITKLANWFNLHESVFLPRETD